MYLLYCNEVVIRTFHTIETNIDSIDKRQSFPSKLQILKRIREQHTKKTYSYTSKINILKYRLPLQAAKKLPHVTSIQTNQLIR